MKFRSLLTSIVITGLLASCSTPATHRFGSEPTYEGAESMASPDSYGADGFMVQRYMPIRAPAESSKFFKQCESAGQSSFVSKTSYFCDFRSGF